jgi:hypothetical protein
MGGPRKPTAGGSPLPSRRTATRTRTVEIRLTPAEEAQVRAQAAAHGRTLSAYFRDLALDESFRRAHTRYVGHLAARLAGFDRLFTRPGEEVGP